ncbi:DHA2 family efflux MFS transporter permease subunit [Companilactobacillus sp.]|uniref:DHA2 family efflux MFS transporter permease subunit n=1 Tax=Companilactobacillus sp. TaxID=2767905 RepID=UPI002639C5B0|nr:DHA2 family efflux MFS transporter permease subunit [Companilactobacillus sp.]
METVRNVDTHGNTYNRTFLILSVLLGGFMTVLTETLLNNGLPAIERSFGISTSTVQWLSTGYLLVIGIMVPISATLLYKFKSKSLYLSSILIFLIGTSTAYLAPNFSILLIGRLIQAVSVGIIMPFMQNIMVMIFPPEKRGMAMGLTGIVVALAPAIGPTLSGWIVDNATWRDLFGILIPVSILVIVLAYFGMRDIVETTNPKLDLISVLESTVGFGGILLGFSIIGSGNLIVSLSALVVGAIGIALLIRRQLRMKTPMLDMKVFKSSIFTRTTWLSSIANMSLLGMQLLVPLYLQSVFQTSALTAGLVMLPGALMMGIVNPLAGNLFDKYGIKKLAITGFSIFTVATIGFLLIDPNTSLVLVSILYAVWMIGISLVAMQLATAGINDLAPNLVAHGNAINSMARQIAAAIATALLVSISSIGAKAMVASGTIGAELFGYRLAYLTVVIISVIGLIGTFKLKNNQSREA